MDHRYIEEHLIADHYLLGKLSAEERAQFEEHFIDCAECLDRLELIKDFRRALRAAAVEELTAAHSQPGASPFGWLAQLSRWQQAAIFAALFLVFVALPAALCVNEIRRLRRALDQTKIAPAPIASSTSISQASPSPSPPLSPSSTAPVDETSKLTQPQINTPIFALSATRGAQSVSGNEIPLPASPGWMVFSLELEGDPAYHSYRATISTADGRRFWRADHLRPNSYGALTISFHSTFFPPGAYLLALEGLPSTGQPVAVANYPFHINRKNP